MTRDFIQSAQVGEGGREDGRRGREGGREEGEGGRIYANSLPAVCATCCRSDYLSYRIG